MRIGQTDRLHRAKAQGLVSAGGHNFNGHAAFEIGRILLPFPEGHFLTGHQRVNERVILGLVHRAVDVVLAITVISGFVIA